MPPLLKNLARRWTLQGDRRERRLDERPDGLKGDRF